MFEAIHTERTSASPAAIWGLWADPARWPEWNDQLESGAIEGDLRAGAPVTVKFKRGGKMRFEVTHLELGRELRAEAKLPGSRYGHEHRVEPAGDGAQITHRVYVSGATSWLFAQLFSRRKLRELAEGFAEHERGLLE